MIRGTKYEEHEMRYSCATKGIFIDVFPFDNYPKGDNFTRRKIIKALRFLIYSKCKYAFDNYSVIYRFISKCACFLLKPIDKGTLCQCLENVEKKYNSVYTEKVISYNAGTKGKDWIYTNDMDDLIEVEVEGYMLNILRNYDEFLTHYYGDYMTPPPINKRENRHGIEKIDFGTYEIKHPIMRIDNE